MDYVANLFDFSGFMPHGYCFLWRWDILLLHVGSDLLIALAYFSIPTALIVFMRRRPDVPFSGIFRLFVGFILTCGVTHLFSIVVMWYPAYTIEGLLKLITAAVSVTTAIALWPLIPKAVAFPSPAIFEERNAKIEDLNERLTARIDSLATLAGGVSHDFNNLLTVIKGNAELLESSAESSEKESVDAIKEAADRAADLCRQMLAYSGRGHFLLEPTDLNEIVRTADIPADPAFNVTYSLSEYIEYVAAAEDQLKQLLNDLVQNSIEAVKEDESVKGEINIATTLEHLSESDLDNATFEHEAQPGNYAVLEVSDNGVGLPEDNVERIFEPYYSTRFTGRGLGLSAVLGIVRGHKGCIFVSSRPRHGTTIRIALPVIAGLKTASYQRSERLDVSRRLVLVVDDEREILNLASNYLSEMNIDVLTTTSAGQAVHLVEKHKDRLEAVVLDYLMPHTTGPDILRRIRRICDVNVYMTSGFSRGEINDEYLHEQLAGFIPKPFSFADFRDIFGDERIDDP